MDEINRKVAEAETVREMMKHPGMVIMRAKIAAHMNQLRELWWKASPEDAERYRQDVRSMRRFLDLAGKIMAEGEVTRRKLADSNVGPSANKAE